VNGLAPGTRHTSQVDALHAEAFIREVADTIPAWCAERHERGRLVALVPSIGN
jgi:hypothetical protein